MVCSRVMTPTRCPSCFMRSKHGIWHVNQGKSLSIGGVSNLICYCLLAIGRDREINSIKTLLTPGFLCPQTFSHFFERCLKFWAINKQTGNRHCSIWFQASGTMLVPYPSIKHEDGLETAILGLEFKVTAATFHGQPGPLSLKLRCASAISTLDHQADIEEVHQERSTTHHSYGSLFYSGKCKFKSFERSVKDHQSDFTLQVQTCPHRCQRGHCWPLFWPFFWRQDWTCFGGDNQLL